jgi:hypothetical protein
MHFKAFRFGAFSLLILIFASLRVSPAVAGGRLIYRECSFEDLSKELARRNRIDCREIVPENAPYFEHLLAEVLKLHLQNDPHNYLVAAPQRENSVFLVGDGGKRTVVAHDPSTSDTVRIFLRYTLLQFVDKIQSLERQQLAEVYLYLKIRTLFPRMDSLSVSSIDLSSIEERDIHEAALLHQPLSLSQLAERRIQTSLISNPVSLVRPRFPQEEEFLERSSLPELRQEIIRLLGLFLSF